MAQVETTIDSIRVAAVSSERAIILQQEGTDCYLPLWVSPSQADILAAHLKGRPDKSTDPAFPPDIGHDLYELGKGA